jgi:hypothetical protein
VKTTISNNWWDSYFRDLKRGKELETQLMAANNETITQEIVDESIKTFQHLDFDLSQISQNIVQDKQLPILKNVTDEAERFVPGYAKRIKVAKNCK